MENVLRGLRINTEMLPDVSMTACLMAVLFHKIVKRTFTTNPSLAIERVQGESYLEHNEIAAQKCKVPNFKKSRSK